MQKEIDLKGNSGWHGIRRSTLELNASFAHAWSYILHTGTTLDFGQFNVREHCYGHCFWWLVIALGGVPKQIKVKACAQCYRCYSYRTGDRYTSNMDFSKNKSCWFSHLFARKLCRTWRVRKWSLPRRPAEVALSESCSSKEFESLTSPRIDSHPRWSWKLPAHWANCLQVKQVSRIDSMLSFDVLTLWKIETPNCTKDGIKWKLDATTSFWTFTKAENSN